MYSVGSSLPVEGVEPGSTLLVVGPPMTGKRDLVLRLLAEGFDSGEGAAVVSTDASAGNIRESLASYTATPGEELPIGVVDCVGDSHGRETLGPYDARVSSPADLTGIGMELTTVLERLYADRAKRLRFGLLSLTTMSMYSDAEQVVRFLHAITSRVEQADALGLVVAHSDTMDEERLQRLRSFVDGVVEVREREGDTGVELRVLGVRGSATDWTPFERGHPGETTGEAEAPTYADDVPVAGSLREILAAVRAESPTLTVCNYDGPPEELAVVERYFDRQGVTVRTASLDVDEPHSVALLHHGDDLLASESVTAIRSAIDIEAATSEEFAKRRTSDLLTNLEQSVFGAQNADKSLLIDVSHSIELLANRTRTGQLHVGFQRLSNLVEDEQASRIYRRLAESGVDVHVYGVPDTTADLPGVTIHELDTPEIRESWFVVYDGGGDPDRQAALLTVQIEDSEQYKGFWTYDSDIVRQVGAYVSATYPDRSAVSERNAN
jgi:KaiC/GvpD/RAD55 family RecA-like ATPase/DICT domain-containing protein